jgi:hypothetical protein
MQANQSGEAASGQFSCAVEPALGDQIALALDECHRRIAALQKVLAATLSSEVDRSSGPFVHRSPTAGSAPMQAGGTVTVNPSTVSSLRVDTRKLLSDLRQTVGGPEMEARATNAIYPLSMDSPPPESTLGLDI